MQILNFKFSIQVLYGYKMTEVMERIEVGKTGSYEDEKREGQI